MTIKALLYGASIAALCSPAFAQTAPATDTTQVDEIIVTAQKRSENLQTVPISITALNEAALTRSGITSLDSIQRYAPGLTMSTVGSGFVSYTYMRGSGTNQIDSGSDPSVAFFIDEVYLTGTAGLQFDLFDVERIEVLKGPQGTLFGRNAAAGAISITTRRPSAVFGGAVAADIGDYGAYTARATVTGPVTQDGKVLFRLSGAMKSRDAFTENAVAGVDDPGEIHSAGGRAQLEFTQDDLNIRLSADGYRARNGMTNQFLATASKAAFVNAADLALLPTDETFYRHYYNVNGHEDQDTYGLTARVEKETPLGQLTAITAYRNNEFDRVQDQDGTILAAYQLNSHQQDSAFSQEIRLSNAIDRLRWVAGLYYYDSSTKREDQILAGPNFATLAYRNTTSIDRNAIDTTSYAAFGQLTWNFTDQLSLTIGGRYTHDKKDDDRYVKRYTFAAYSVHPEATWSSFDPSVTLNYQMSPRFLAYASYRQGFKSGGFQTLLPATSALAATPFEPEQVTSYEVGVKSEWFDRRLRANIAVFRADITNQQVLRTVVTSTVSNNIIDNAGQTRTDGVDLALTAQPTSALRLEANMTFQEARFTEYNSGTTSFAGRSQLRSPDFTGSYGAEYTFDLASAGELTVRGEYNYQSEVFFDAANSNLPGQFQPGFGLVNARITYTPANADWEVALWARNLNDEEYIRNVAVSGVTGLAAPGDPRTVGVALRLNF
jgi:iron complex outermembrane receptor protein